MKLFFYALRPFDELAYCEQASKQYGIEFGYTTEYPTHENICLAQGYDAVSTTPCDMGAEMVQAFDEIGVRYLPCRSIGYDHIDLVAAKEHGMRVSNVSYPPNGVANYAIMLMLMATRKTMQTLKRSEAQDYSLKGKIGRDLNRMTVGVIGTGRIGQTVIQGLSGFGCKILAYDMYQNDSVKAHATYVSLEELLAQSDIITLHTNATEENTHLLNETTIAQMKDGAFIINTARGKLIDTAALIAGLECGKLGGAALDVLEAENGLYYYNRAGDVIENREMAILRAFPNVILTPHTAFYTEDAVESMINGCFMATNDFGNGKTPSHEIQL